MGFFSNLFGPKINTELEAALTQGALLIDVRTAAEFASGSAPGALNIPLDQIRNQRNRLETNKPIVVFCRSGNRSAQAKRILEQLGITSVINGGSWGDVKAALAS